MTIRIAQLSDTHFLEQGEAPEGGFGYDIDAAFDAVLGDLTHHHALDPLDLIVVTGDVADHGRPGQYGVALEAFRRLPAPVVVIPGNHDQDTAFTSGLSDPDDDADTASHASVTTPRVIEVKNWCFLLVDSNAGLMLETDDYDQRLWGNGLLGAPEAEWIRTTCATTEADHVFVWLHHPVGTGNGAVGPPAAYEDEWADLLAASPKIRGIGAGHTHMPTTIDFHGCPVHVCASLKANFDAEVTTMLPPGWRSYGFEPDGTVTSTDQLVDGDAWPRRPLPRSVAALLRGEISHAEFDAIVARKRQG